MKIFLCRTTPFSYFFLQVLFICCFYYFPADLLAYKTYYESNDKIDHFPAIYFSCLEP